MFRGPQFSYLLRLFLDALLLFLLFLFSVKVTAYLQQGAPVVFPQRLFFISLLLWYFSARVFHFYTSDLPSVVIPSSASVRICLILTHQGSSVLSRPGMGLPCCFTRRDPVLQIYLQGFRFIYQKTVSLCKKDTGRWLLGYIGQLVSVGTTHQ